MSRHYNPFDYENPPTYDHAVVQNAQHTQQNQSNEARERQQHFTTQRNSSINSNPQSFYSHHGTSGSSVQPALARQAVTVPPGQPSISPPNGPFYSSPPAGPFYPSDNRGSTISSDQVRPQLQSAMPSGNDGFLGSYITQNANRGQENNSVNTAAVGITPARSLSYNYSTEAVTSYGQTGQSGIFNAMPCRLDSDSDLSRQSHKSCCVIL